jgi:hypothetical protein
MCDGAVPQVHGHVFTDAGSFGSLDQNGQQVHDGQYAVVDDHGCTLVTGRFEYEVADGSLVLKPLVAAEDREAALATPTSSRRRGGRWR